MGKSSATEEEIIAAAKIAQCHDFIFDFPEKYDTQVGELGGKLSDGEKQRISIAMAVLKSSPVLVLDEATVFADPENEDKIQEAINSLVMEKTLVIIAHRLSTITSADQIIVLNSDGEIKEIGNHKELIKAGGLYTRFWEARQRARSWKICKN